MDTKIIINNILKQLNIETNKPFSVWLTNYFNSILNGINIYFDTLNETKENLIKVRRDFKREIETAEKFNLDILRQKSTDLARQFEEIIQKFENGLKTTNDTVQSELKNDLKQFHDKLFVKTCFFLVNTKSTKNDCSFKLIVLNFGPDNCDLNLRCLLKCFLK